MMDSTPGRKRGPSRSLIVLAGLLALGLSPRAADADEKAVVQALREGGVAVLLRHGRTTPGVGDPPGWQLGRCSTQRNLDPEGRAQARRLGAWFRQRRIAPTMVRSSPWCRARDTARLVFGRSMDWPALANLFGNPGPAKKNTEEVRRYIAGLRPGEIAALVSHGSSISAVVGESVSQGEAVVVRARRDADGQIETTTVGRISVP